MSGRSLIRGALGEDFRVDLEVLSACLPERDGEHLSESRAAVVVMRLRQLAADIESEVAGLRELREGSTEFEDREAEFFEGAVSEVGKLGVVHDPNGGVGVVDGVLGVVSHGARHRVSSGHSSSPSGLDATSSASSEETVGDGVGPVSGSGPTHTPKHRAVS